MDATFYYVVGGMTLMAAAFGNIIILNFVSISYVFYLNFSFTFHTIYNYVQKMQGLSWQWNQALMTNQHQGPLKK